MMQLEAAECLEGFLTRPQRCGNSIFLLCLYAVIRSDGPVKCPSLAVVGAGWDTKYLFIPVLIKRGMK